VETLRIVQLGVGPIGARVVRLLLEKNWAELVGGIDVDKAKVGRDLGEVVGSPSRVGVDVSADADRVLKTTNPDVVVQCTGSYLERVKSELRQVMEAGSDVVSTCEELAFPYYRHPQLSKELDQLAKMHGVSVLGTGVNPGFVMDFLPLVMSGVCQNIEFVRAERVVDAAKRREPLQRKVGAGLSVDEFMQKVRRGEIKHVGLPESVALIAAGLGWSLEGIDEKIDPVVSEERVVTDFLTVEPGEVAGVRQIARGIHGGSDLIILDLRMYVGAKDPHDSVLIQGSPPIDLTIKGGVHGDLATAAVVVNCIPRVHEAESGLLTMKDIRVPHITPRQN
jgi:4-hydroxy-tetrahydrodipicolinate reductase